jgi:hypothetical protein
MEKKISEQSGTDLEQLILEFENNTKQSNWCFNALLACCQKLKPIHENEETETEDVQPKPIGLVEQLRFEQRATNYNLIRIERLIKELESVI